MVRVKVLLRNPRREVELAGPIARPRPARPARAQPRVGAGDPGRHARAGRRAARRRRHHRDPPGDLRGLRDEVPGVPRAGGHRPAAPQRQLLRRALPARCAATRWPRPSTQFDMLAPGERVLVAVSGGKDTLALWDLLLELGYEADGLYLGLGIGDYSDESAAYARDFAEPHGAPRSSRSTCPTTTATTSRRRPGPPSACRARRAGSRSATCSTRRRATAATTWSATGHNLDDEAAVLFGNVLRWDTEYLARQLPVLPARDGFPRKVKPLVRLSEREMAAYCVLRRHRLHRRGVPDGRRQQAPRLQGRRSTPSSASRRAPSTRSTSASSSGPRRCSHRRRRPSAASWRRAPAAAPRPPARCAPSAAWSSGPRAHPPVAGAGAEGAAPSGRRPRPVRRMSERRRPFAGGDRVLLHRREGPSLPGDAEGAGRVPHPRRLRAPRRRWSGRRRGARVRSTRGRPVRRPAARRSRTSC